jgi:hypothetical protein
MRNMRYPFEPQSNAVIGASHDTAKIGYIVILISKFCEKRLRDFSKFLCPIK